MIPLDADGSLTAMTVKAEKVAIVTGAGRGIGRAAACALAREGYALVLAARTFAQLEETRADTGLAPRDALIVLLDLADPNAPENLVGAALDHFGRIDLLINNAGWAPPRTPLMKLGADDLDRMLAVNLRAPLELARRCARRMANQTEGGFILNVASAAARHCPAGEAVYAATKSGLIAFTRACFEEFRGSRLRTAVIVPGLTDTTLIPQNKRLDRTAMLHPDEVAEAIVRMVTTPPPLCPLELVLEPSRNPLRA